MGDLYVQAVGAGTATVTFNITTLYRKWDSVLGYWREDYSPQTVSYTFEVTKAPTPTSTEGSNNGASSTPPPASSGICGPYVDYTLKDGVLTIFGTGEMFDYTSSKAAPWGKNAVSQVVINEGVTDIGNYAFSGNKMNRLT